MTPKGQMAFGGGPPITHLPPAMKAMFQPGPPLVFREKALRRPPMPYSGVAAYLGLFEASAPPPRDIQPTPRERRAEAAAAAKVAHAAAVAAAAREWDPSAPPPPGEEGSRTKDAYKTLFVARLAYETDEARLRREFEPFGPVAAVAVVHGRSDDGEPGGPRGYAFIEFEREADMRAAYKRADGRRIDGRRVLVDVERGRTVRHWRPRRLGGGLGASRAAPSEGRAAPAPATHHAPRPSHPPARPDYSSSSYRQPNPVPRPPSSSDRRRDRSRSRDRRR